MSTITAPEHGQASPKQIAKIDITKAMTLIDITRHEWPGQYQLALLKTIADDGGQALDRSHVKTPKGDFIPTSLRKVIADTWNDVNIVVDKWTRSFGMADLRIIATANLEPFFVELRPARAGVNQMVETLKARYLEIVHHNRDFWVPKIGLVRYEKHIQPKILSRHKLEQRFRLEIGLRQWEDVRSVRVSATIQEEVNQAVRTTQAKIDDAIDGLLVEPRQQLTKALTDLQALFERNGRITPGSFTAVRDAIQQCRAFSECVDVRLLQQAEGLARLVDRAITDATAQHDADQRVTLGSILVGYRGTLTQAAEQVIQAANDAESLQMVQRQFGRRTRVINVRED